MSQSFAKQRISRRHLLQLGAFGAGILGTGSLTGWLGPKALAKTSSVTDIPGEMSNQAIAATPGATRPQISPDQALKELIVGNQRYVTSKRQNPNQTVARIKEVAKGQAPFAALLSCADSRVVPEMLFDQGIGNLFVVRVAGNVAATEEIASEEYACAALGVSLLMVLGHERCGAVDAAVKAQELPGVISSLIHDINPAVEETVKQPGDRLDNAVKANIRLQVKRLLASPVLAGLVKQGKLKVVGAYYDLDAGEVNLL